ncbi:MAG TPA: hypothetical protein VGB37_01110 [Candidatus Lokiarchaeia archaeon]
MYKYKIVVDFNAEEEVNNIESILKGFLVSNEFKGTILKKSLTKSTEREIKSKVIRLNKDVNLKPAILKKHLKSEVLQKDTNCNILKGGKNGL